MKDIEVIEYKKTNKEQNPYRQINKKWEEIIKEQASKNSYQKEIEDNLLIRKKTTITTHITEYCDGAPDLVKREIKMFVECGCSIGQTYFLVYFLTNAEDGGMGWIFGTNKLSADGLKFQYEVENNILKLKITPK